MRRIITMAAIIAAGLTAPCTCFSQNHRPETTVVYRGGTDGYHTYRIPGMVVTESGTVLAFCEGRKTGGGDAGDIDLLVKRSTDGGRIWSEQTIVHEEGDAAKITIGNPCPVVDRQTGTIWLPFCRDNDRVFMMHSSDDGQTWTTPREITADVKAPEWGWYATGPGHGIQIQRGPHAGRLLIPSDCRIGPGRDKWRTNGHSFMLYSDDHGKTWQHGELTGPGMNECEVVERTDGSLLLSMRNYRGKNLRAFAVSTDGGQTWSEPENHKDVYCPTCQASIHRYESDDQTLFLYSGPGGPGRTHMTVRTSYDEGVTWPAAHELFAGPSAYSELAVLPNGEVLCLFEAGEKGAYQEIRCARFPVEWATAEAELKE